MTGKHCSADMWFLWQLLHICIWLWLIGCSNRKSSSRFHGKSEHGSDLRLHVSSHHPVCKAAGFHTSSTILSSRGVHGFCAVFCWWKAERIPGKDNCIPFTNPTLQPPPSRYETSQEDYENEKKNHWQFTSFRVVQHTKLAAMAEGVRKGLCILEKLCLQLLLI